MGYDYSCFGAEDMAREESTLGCEVLSKVKVLDDLFG